jgi:LPXTG-motif cell wall-anchored protein
VLGTSFEQEPPALPATGSDRALALGGIGLGLIVLGSVLVLLRRDEATT